MTKSNFETLLEVYDYDLPESFIAQVPASPRDSAKLLTFDRQTKQTNIDTFKNLVKYLPKNSVLVFNKTKVIPARLSAKKPTGGVVEILFLAKEEDNIRVLANKKLEENLILTVNKNIFFTVVKKNENEYILKPSFKITELLKILDTYGTTPIPPYIKHTALNETKLRTEYQTVFARDEGSVAAPTASLHFTNNLLDEIKKAGHKIYYVTLHVNLGTFAKLTEKHVVEKRLHSEYYEIDPDTLEKLNKDKANKKNIVAVGTTVVRALESSSDKTGQLKNISATTDLFITEDTPLKFVNSVITNFHVPKSSLLMLIASFTGRKQLFELYKMAQENNFRFFSFGDGMLIT